MKKWSLRLEKTKFKESDWVREMRNKMAKIVSEGNTQMEDIVDKIIKTLEVRKCDALTYLHQAKRIGINS